MSISGGNFMRRIFAIVALCAALGVTIVIPARAVSFVVTDGDFIGGVYDFQFRNATTSRTLVNGVNTGVSNPTLTNTGWQCCRDDGPRFWHAQGPDFGFAELTNGALTMGWDLSAVTGKIAKVELNPRNFLFQFGQWNGNAVGDSISGFISAPGSFNSGPYTELYTFTGTAGNQDTIGAGTLIDYASFLSLAWRNNPGLLEFLFTYSQTPGTPEETQTIPAAHLQMFRDVVGGDAFTLRVTLENVAPVPLPAALPLFGTGLAGLWLLGRWKRRKSAAA